MSYDYNGRVYNDLRFLKDFFYSGNSYGADAIKNINEYIRTRQYNITISRAKYGILGKATYVSVNSRETQTPYFGIDDQTAMMATLNSNFFILFSNFFILLLFVKPWASGLVF